MTERYEEMGMSDKQFNGYLREIIANLEKVREQVGDNEDLVALIDRLQQTLED